jgi:glycosyltransferase involved in cell wall biosynthesis
MHVAIVGTYPPTRCGIATFTADVERSLQLHDVKVTIIPVVDPAPPVLTQAGSIESGDTDLTEDLVIRRDELSSYTAAARRINEVNCDVVLIQHEFGIFGGASGSHITLFMDALDPPCVVNFHTVLPEFSDAQKLVIEALSATAALVTVFTATARNLLIAQQLTAPEKLVVVPHGAPMEMYRSVNQAHVRAHLGLPSSGPVLSTFGLLSEGKGIELAVRAVADLVADFPDIRYVVAGRTHPGVLRHEGEQYRRSIAALVHELGLDEHVVFLDRFMDIHELADLLAVTDVFCTPYHNCNQIVSGALTFALAAGCPVVSTPYLYARDVLSGGAGILVPTGDAHGFASAIRQLLPGGSGALAAREAARAASAMLSWPSVGAETRDALSNAVVRSESNRATSWMLSALPESSSPDQRPSPNHLRVLCDDTAMLQHANFKVPRAEDGYCVDDAARMLPLAAAMSSTTGDGHWNTVVARLLTFLRDAAPHRDGLMRNFMSWDRRWLDEPHDGDHVGRAIWGLGELAGQGHPFSGEARQLMVWLCPALSTKMPRRALTYAALGLCAASADHDTDLAAPFERTIEVLRGWVPDDHPTWRWSEPRLTYDNARVPEVLIRVGARIGDIELVERGATMLRWLDDLCLSGEHYRFPGHLGVDNHSGVRWSGDEQPLEAAAMADAHQAMWMVDHDAAHLTSIERSWSWFLGNNRLGRAVGDLNWGSCFDGLGRLEVNFNCGAESTIAFHRCAFNRPTHQSGSAQTARQVEV